MFFCHSGYENGRGLGKRYVAVRVRSGSAGSSHALWNTLSTTLLMSALGHEGTLDKIVETIRLISLNKADV